jgi:uncharacterized DUF497 family protein
VAIQLVRFERAERKRRRTIRERSLDFLDARKLFDGRPTFTYHTPRRGEDRWGTVGLLEVEGEQDFYLVVWTERGHGTIRVISFYRGDDWEIRAYRRLYG